MITVERPTSLRAMVTSAAKLAYTKDDEAKFVFDVTPVDAAGNAIDESNIVHVHIPANASKVVDKEDPNCNGFSYPKWAAYRICTVCEIAPADYFKELGDTGEIAGISGALVTLDCKPAPEQKTGVDIWVRFDHEPTFADRELSKSDRMRFIAMSK